MKLDVTSQFYYRGAKPKAVYVGSTLVWPRGTTTVPVGQVAGGVTGMPRRGFFSGGSGVGIDWSTRGKFGTWRGDPVDYITHFADTADQSGWYLPGVDNRGTGPASNFLGHLDLACGGPAAGSAMTAAAGGSLDGRFRDLIRLLKSYRTFGGVVYSTSLSPMHEANGSWFPWSVTTANLSAYGNLMRRWRDIAAQEWPDLWFSPAFNGDSTNTNVTPAQMWTAAGGGDAVAVSRYNHYPHIGTSYSGKFVSWESGSTTGTVDNPVGVERWRQFAAARGVPMHIREYANNGDDPSSPDNAGDDTYWVPNFYRWAAANGGLGAGKLLGESWYNQPAIDDGRWAIFNPGGPVKMPITAQAYADAHPVTV